MKYIVSGELTADKVKDIINYWQLNDRPKLNTKYNYYIGKQKITDKFYSDPSKPCNRIVTNFCHSIVQQYLGFNIGIPVTYQVDDNVQYFLKYNDVIQKDNLLLKNALTYGKAFELQYLDSDGENRFDIIDTRFGIDVYSDELADDELKGFIRIYSDDNIGVISNNYNVVVYTQDKITTYKTVGEFGALEFVDEVPHNFGQVPVVVFSLNDDEEGIFEQIISLQDAYNTLISSEIDDWEAFVDCYLVLSGVTAEKEDIQEMKTNRVLLLDPDSSAEYLTKQVNDTQIQNMLKDIRDRIMNISNCPDFNDKDFMASSGIALQYKLVGFNNVSKAIMNRMEKALRKRIELFGWIEQIKGDKVTDFKIVFTQNIPANTLDTAQIVNTLRGLVSDETLLSLLPFVDDAKEELKKAQAEKQENMKLYDFGSSENEEGADNELLGKENSNSD